MLHMPKPAKPSLSQNEIEVIKLKLNQWLEFPYNYVFLSLKIAFIIANSVDPEEMPHPMLT